jgi:hypothetical protein
VGPPGPVGPAWRVWPDPPPGAPEPPGCPPGAPGRPEPGACGTGRGAAGARPDAARGDSARPPGAVPDGPPAAGLPAAGAPADGAAGTGPGRAAPRVPPPACPGACPGACPLPACPLPACPLPDGAAAPGRPAPRCGAEGAWAARPAPCPCLPPPSGPKASLSLRTTGASIVEDADRTNSPMSWSLTMTALLSTPSSFASSYTRTFATTLLYSARTPGPFTRTISPVRGRACSGLTSACGLHRLVLIECSSQSRPAFRQVAVLALLCPVRRHTANRRNVTSPGRTSRTSAALATRPYAMPSGIAPPDTR